MPIYPLKQGVAFSSMLAGADGECDIWADILNPQKAKVLGTYTAGQYAGCAPIAMFPLAKAKPFTSERI